MSHPGLAAATSLKESKPNLVAIKPNQLDFRLGLCYQLISLLLVFPWNVANHRPGKQITCHYLPTSHGFSICFRVSGLHPRNTKLAASRSFLDPRHDWTYGIPPRAIHFQGTKQSFSHYFRGWGHWNTSYKDTLVLEQTSIDYWHNGDRGLKGTSSYQENSFNISSVYTVHFQIGTGYTKLTINHSELSLSLSLTDISNTSDPFLRPSRAQDHLFGGCPKAVHLLHGKTLFRTPSRCNSFATSSIALPKTFQESSCQRGSINPGCLVGGLSQTWCSCQSNKGIPYLDRTGFITEWLILDAFFTDVALLVRFQSSVVASSCPGEYLAARTRRVPMPLRTRRIRGPTKATRRHPLPFG